MITDPENKFRKIQEEAYEIFVKKNADYGQAYVEFGVIGLLIRLCEKLRRVINVTNNQIELVNDEGLRDTLLDIHNYTGMAIMLIDDDKNDK